ncbi:hypothetical protein D3OALGB2SA_4043 [Olavius algarvensis associated proteobacterium Delta 3]|nr:hypothetical protein D3OALGB2SA_4043 [Olavius algarvensis associated proteobacterium Delta 3]
MDRFFCRKCGFTQTGTRIGEIQVHCPKCGDPLRYEKDVWPAVEGEVHVAGPVPPGENRYPFEFSGNAKEYFRIWIVNLFLTVITGGIYAAWAKVRTRRYLYASTRLAGHSFDYVASPTAILKGNLILGFGLACYFLTRSYKPELMGAVVILAYIVLPFLVCKSLRFFARNSIYRNIRFRFAGSLKESYKTYFLFPILIPLTLGVIFPFWGYLKKKFFFGHLGYGTSDVDFDARPGVFYKYYALASILMIILVATAIFFFMFVLTGSAIFAGEVGGDGDRPSNVFFYIGFLMNGLFLLSASAVQQFVYAKLNNYCFNHTRLGRVRFESSIRADELIWIRLTNIFAIIISVGLLIPWAKIRRTRYILSRITILTPGSLDEFVSEDEHDVSALGEAATDFFDLEISL